MVIGQGFVLKLYTQVSIWQLMLSAFDFEKSQKAEQKYYPKV
jgi:hypothetical protein